MLSTNIGITFEEVFFYTFALIAFIIALIPSNLLFNEQQNDEKKKDNNNDK